MLSPETIQKAMITLLKADAPLVAALTDAARIKEADWRGTTFEYPAVRLDISAMSPQGNGPCAESWLGIAGSIYVFSKEHSSEECLQILGLVENAIQRKRLTETGMTSLELRPEIVNYPIRDDDIWRGEVIFATVAIET